MIIAGISSLIARSWFNAKRATGLLAYQSPVQSWEHVEPARSTSTQFIVAWKDKAPCLPIAWQRREFLAPHLEAFAVQLGHSPEAEAKAIAQGRFRAAPNEFVNLGTPVDWHRNQAGNVAVHWSKISIQARNVTRTPDEVALFNWAYTLVRAWALTGASEHIETFWQLFEDWIEKNPPNLGVQWARDESVARRLTAVAFAVQAFRFQPGSTDERLFKTARFVAVSAKRLRVSFAYARATSSLAELNSAVALFTAGTLWPQLKDADVWRADGLEFLIATGKKIISSRGTLDNDVAQASAQILELFVWAEIILRAEHERESLPESLQAKIRLLIQRVSQCSTRAVNYTPWFSLSGCLNGDLRPAISAAMILFTGRHYTAGPWDEASLLLVGPLCDSAAAL